MKWILRLALVLVILVVVVAGAGYFFLNQIVQRVVVDAGNEATGTPTSLAGVGLSPLSGSAKLSGFGIGNPEGYGGGDVFGFTDADVAVDTGSLFGDTIVVPRFHIDGATVRVAYAGGKLNVMELLERLQGDAPVDPDVPAPDEPADGAAATRVIINDLQVRNTRVLGSIEVPGLNEAVELNLVIPDILMKNVGSDGSGVTAKEAMRLVLETVFANASREAINADVLAGQLDDLKAQGRAMLDEGRAALDAQRQRLDDAKEQAESTLETGQQAVDQAKQQFDSVKQGIGGLFGGKPEDDAAEE